jgi:hypothetical protein
MVFIAQCERHPQNRESSFNITPFSNPEGCDSLLHIRYENMDMLDGFEASLVGSSIHM